jgi:hypothetical protein
MNQTQHNRIATALIYGAKGDLAFDDHGNIRYGWDSSIDQRVVFGVGPILLKNTREGFQVTGEGANWILENLQGCVSKHDERALDKLNIYR